MDVVNTPYRKAGNNVLKHAFNKDPQWEQQTSFHSIKAELFSLTSLKGKCLLDFVDVCTYLYVYFACCVCKWLAC
jgi:hypothetical protein